MDKTKIIVGLLVGSLAFNIYNVVQMNSINKQLTEHISNTSNWVSSEISSLYSDLYSWQQEDKWVKDIEFKPIRQSSDPNQIVVDVKWSIEELESGADVFFLYRENEQENWEKVTAVPNDQFTQYASIILDPTKEYMYKIIAEGNYIKGSNTSFIPSDSYRPVSLSVGYSSTHTAGSSVIQYEIYVEQYVSEEDYYQAEEIFAIFTGKDGEIEKEPLNERETGWNLSFNWDQETTVQLEVHYTNGYVELMETEIAEIYMD
ncbi:hypothetical protein [Halalkalibacter akibai]|uniref:Uncharacterized protein n=1 Tax=Halalkalibacter akibai (strain ATCC 43226 / DSM 21942 / CIP 109018 / JCM 9157 / 1139) TaxID=1236973 RepID=W4QNK7_HALA3|nr:hypothetical protein [Halalkalibacter akibai]GAE33258.1 hypothetical protein JCM9157_252 [Halalkalibacter akibai JCM 9157]